MKKIGALFVRIKTSPTLTCILCYVALVAGYMPFYLANIVANDRDNEYPVALLVMILIACGFGLFAWLWIQSLRNSLNSYISAIGGTLYLLILLYIVNDVDRIPVYVALLAVPALFFLMQRQRARFLVCAIVLATLLFCCLNPSIRIKRYAHNLRGDCFCCGYQERDIHELILLGDNGCTALADCLAEETQNERPPWCGWRDVDFYALKELKDNHVTNPLFENTITNAMNREWTKLSEHNP